MKKRFGTSKINSLYRFTHNCSKKIADCKLDLVAVQAMLNGSRHHDMARPQVADGEDGLQLAANILWNVDQLLGIDREISSYTTAIAK
jgi:hypothetical protein